MGRVKCPENYPASAPQINLLTDNGRFSLQEDGICLSISSFHPESWNPAWKVSQIVVGLSMFWLTGQDTYGAVYEHDYGRDMSFEERRMHLAMKSRQEVMNSEKFKQIFEPYAKAIGIDQEPQVAEWGPLKEKWAKKAAEKEAKRLAAEEKKRQEEEAKRLEAEKAAKAKENEAIKQYFKLIMEKNMTKYIGQPHHAKKFLRNLIA